MKKFTFFTMLLMCLHSFGQTDYSGSGYFPIDTVFTVLLNDSNFIKIPENSIWHKSLKGKEGLNNPDTSFVLVTDTNNANVTKGDYYFDLEVPNEMILGGKDSELFQRFDEWYSPRGLEDIFWSYEIIIEHQHDIKNENYGSILLKEFSALPFDTVGKWYNDGIYHCPLRITNSSIRVYPADNFQYPEYYLIEGTKNTDWVYTWLYYEFLPASTKSLAIDNENYAEDTTTLRIMYHSLDNIGDSPGWMIKSISIKTYMCTTNCPTDIQNNSTNNTENEIYPNPVNSQFTFIPNSLNQENIHCKIVNHLGQELPVSYQKVGNSYLFNVDNLSQGVYFLVASDQNKSYSHCFIKL